VILRVLRLLGLFLPSDEPLVASLRVLVGGLTLFLWALSHARHVNTPQHAHGAPGQLLSVRHHAIPAHADPLVHGLPDGPRFTRGHPARPIFAVYFEGVFDLGLRHRIFLLADHAGALPVAGGSGRSGRP